MADITEVLERETAAWNAHDPDGVAACYSEYAELLDVRLPNPLHGRQALRDAVAAYTTAVPDATLPETIVSFTSPRSGGSPAPTGAS